MWLWRKKRMAARFLGDVAHLHTHTHSHGYAHVSFETRPKHMDAFKGNGGKMNAFVLVSPSPSALNNITSRGSP